MPKVKINKSRPSVQEKIIIMSFISVDGVLNTAAESKDDIKQQNNLIFFNLKEKKRK